MTLDEMNAKYGKPTVSLNTSSPSSGDTSDLESAWGMQPSTQTPEAPSLSSKIRDAFTGTSNTTSPIGAFSPQSGATVTSPTEFAKGAVKGIAQQGISLDTGLQAIGNAVLHPINTLEGKDTPGSGFESFKPGTQENTELNNLYTPTGQDQKTGAVTSDIATSLIPAGEAKPIIEAGISKAEPILAKTADTVSSALEKKATNKNLSGVLDAIKETEDTMTPTQKKEAIDAGRQTITNKMGGTQVDYLPSDEIKNAASILNDAEKTGKGNVVTPKDQPNVVLAKTKNVISKLGQDAENYLEANPTKITNKEDYDMFDGLKKNAEKNMTKSEINAYDEQIELFQKQLLGRPGGYTTANYYKALKDWENNIGERLPKGKESLLDPNGTAKQMAAADIRTGVRDLIASKHPEFSDKMYDLMSLYKAKDIALQNASKVKTQSFFEKHPTATKIIGTGATAAGLGEGYNLLK